MIINYSKKLIVGSNVSTRGFTLIETLVAVAILLIAVAGPITLIGDALHRMYFARDEAIAVNLAQEGVEMVRRVRDSNMLNSPTSGWLDNLAVGTYTVDVGNFITSSGVGSPNTFVIPCGPACIPQSVYLDAATGLYRQSAVSTPTQFSRIVTISNCSGAPTNECMVTSDVTWKTGGSSGSVSAQEYIYSWAI